jgi:O-antigen ligase
VSTLLRVVIGAALAWCIALAVAAPETPLVADVATLAIILCTVCRPAYGLAGVLLLAPAGTLLAPVPARVAEVLAWAFVATLMLTRWRRSHEHGIPAVRTPIVLFGTCVVASWLGLVIAGAAGLEPGSVPRLVAHTIRADHLLYSSAEPETWTMLQVLAGLALCGAAIRVARVDGDTAPIAAWALVASGVVLAILTEIDVLRDSSRYGPSFLWRYVQGERFSLHLADLNAAGSQYVLAGLAAVALAVTDRSRRYIWIAAGVVMLPALWLTGSRSAALGAILIGASIIPFARRQVRANVTRAGTATIVLVAIGTIGANILAATQSTEQGSAMGALRMRSEFLVTSARMFASAPAFGVGVGHYHERSAEFMPASLRAVYPFENAHNYFAQQFAELGIVGGVLFIWLVAAGVRAGWSGLTRGEATSAPLLALVAGCIGYLLTCVTGHPLLVPEAALPFWGAFGVMIGASRQRAPAKSPVDFGYGRKIAAAAAIVLLVTSVALQARRYAQVSTPPTERGFHAVETSRDGVRFNWMTRHGVFYIGSQPGFLAIPVHAPDLPVARKPFVVDVDVGGRRIGSYTIEPGRWNELRIGLRDRARTPFRRVDLRVNQHWTRRRDLRLREDDDMPRSVMVGEVKWQPAGAR